MTEINDHARRRQKREWYHRNRERLKLQRDLGVTAKEADLLLKLTEETKDHER